MQTNWHVLANLVYILPKRKCSLDLALFARPCRADIVKGNGFMTGFERDFQ